MRPKGGHTGAKVPKNGWNLGRDCPMHRKHISCECS